MGAAGVALAGLQLKGATGVAAGVGGVHGDHSAAVQGRRCDWVARSPSRSRVVTAIAGSSSSAVAAGMLVTVLLGVVAQFLKRSRESQDQTELLFAQLQDARDEQTRAAAIAERGRIAGELHDVLAHSLSGAAIQLQGARKLADREHAAPPLSEAIDRASELVKAGLANARQAVGALRGDPLPTVAQLPALIDSYRADMKLDVTLRIEGEARDAPCRSEPRALPRRTGSADECRAVRTRARAPRSRCVTSPTARGCRSSNGSSVRRTAPRAWAAGAGWTGCVSGSSEPAARCRAGPTAEGWRVEIEVPG